MNCRPGGGWPRRFPPHLHGLILVALGALLVLLFVPLRLWMGVIGLALIVFGLVVWKCSSHC